MAAVESVLTRAWARAPAAGRDQKSAEISARAIEDETRRAKPIHKRRQRRPSHAADIDMTQAAPSAAPLQQETFDVGGADLN